MSVPDSGGIASGHAGGALDAEESLADIRSLTQSSLAYLQLDELLGVLLDRILALAHCDTAAVLLLDQGSKHLVARAARGLEEEVRQGVRIPLGTGFAGRIASERRPIVLDRVDRTTVANPILWEKGIRSMLGVPLISSGDLLGVLHVGSYSKRSFPQSEVMLLELVADKVAASVQANIAESERRASEVLQRSLLPSALPDHPKVEFASRYAPAERGDIGGDWYDAFEVPNGDLWIVTGDVVGHGLQPAIVMGRLRSTIEAYALLGMSPEDVLRAANRKLQLFEPDAMATVICGKLSPPFDELRVCSAGHPPPVVANPDEEPRLLDLRPGPPLGVVGELEIEASRWKIADGSLIVFYTDGLVERKGEILSDGLERLRSVVKSDSPNSICAQIMDSLIGSYISVDDVALLALRVNTGPSDTNSLRSDEADISILRSEVFPSQPESVKAARRFVAECVEILGLQRIPDVQLMVSELATNAVLHAQTPFDVIVEKTGESEARIEVRDFGGNSRDLRTPEFPLSGDGRGLLLVDALAKQWAIEDRPGGHGKAIWFIISS